MLPPTRLRVALAQINVTVGDLDGNTALVADAVERATAEGAHVVVLPELALTGYPPEDLVLKPGFVADNRAALEKVAVRTGDTAAVIGFVDADDRHLYDAAAVCCHGQVVGIARKRLLPNYGVFDERRYFRPGVEIPVFDLDGIPAGIAICEDLWEPGPMADLAAAGAEVVLCPNASPYFAGRIGEREEMLRQRVAETGLPIVYVNLVGGQDELVFDGGSMVVGRDGRVAARLPQFREDLVTVELDLAAGTAAAGAVVAEPCDPEAEIYEALVLGTRDYVRKNGFTDVVLGLSGGIDSSLVTVVAADAVGPERVHAVSLPSRYSSEGSVADAEALCAGLGVELRTIPIEEGFAALLHMLEPSFEGLAPDVAEENLQGRIRAAVLMALANKLGWLVLICGNKSELAVGYTTVYGVDMAGGFAVIKDVPKTVVYDLARWRNAQGPRPPIPEAVLTKAPSAELRPGQRDDQSLPPYEVLDPIVAAYVEQDRTAAEIIAAGHDPDLVRRITGLVDAAEWKRRQAPPGVRITPKAFGRDRRMPITNAYRG